LQNAQAKANSYLGNSFTRDAQPKKQYISYLTIAVSIVY
jgi:hypothetical protein